MKLTTDSIDPSVSNQVPAKFVTHFKIMPVRRQDGVFIIAASNPHDLNLLDDLQLMLKCRVRLVASSEKEIQEAIKKYYGIGAETMEEILSENDRQIEVVGTETSEQDIQDEAMDASIIKFVNQIMLEAIRDCATDIHIEPFEQELRIRYRIDGLLYEASAPPAIKHFQSAIVSRVKIMADLNIAEKRLPQDGRIKIRMAREEFDLRVSILPTPFGESVNIRILTRGNIFYGLEQLGLSATGLIQFDRLIKKPHGIILVTGPTGSGKTTTLYACLSKINHTDRKIITIEDPIEYQLKGITQMQVLPKIGFTFASGLRSILRHDPDIIMVGEIRDSETAEITIRTALTGHLVFSTLHTNDASGAVSRLLDIGIEPYLVTSSVEAIIAQRLVRKVCTECQEEYQPETEALHEMGVEIDQARAATLSFKRGHGCEQCKHTGYKGRTAIYEILVLNEEIESLILKHTPASTIKQRALAYGMKTLRQDGWDKVTQGITTIGEVLRVTQEDELAGRD